jgi:hypothetical protein
MIYALGGVSTTTHAEIDIFDPRTNRCVLARARLPAAAQVFLWQEPDGSICAARGPEAGLLPSYLWVYDPAGMVRRIIGFDFSSTPALGNSSYGHDPATGRVYVFGRVDKSGNCCSTVHVLIPSR